MLLNTSLACNPSLLYQIFRNKPFGVSAHLSVVIASSAGVLLEDEDHDHDHGQEEEDGQPDQGEDDPCGHEEAERVTSLLQT